MKNQKDVPSNWRMKNSTTTSSSSANMRRSSVMTPGATSLSWIKSLPIDLKEPIFPKGQGKSSRPW